MADRGPARAVRRALGVTSGFVFPTPSRPERVRPRARAADGRRVGAMEALAPILVAELTPDGTAVAGDAELGRGLDAGKRERLAG